MSTYLQSLTATSVIDTNHIATVQGTYTTTDGGTNPNYPYNLTLEEISSSGQVIESDANITNATFNSDGTFAVTYNASAFNVNPPDGLEVATTDTANGSTISTQPLYPTTAIDGYLAGAQIFVDTNANGVLDAGEYSATTDASGNAFLPAGSGQIVAVGGTDTLTGLAFTGTLTAPSAASVVTPITTLVNQIAQLNGGNVAAAEASVANSFGISSSLNLDTLDPIASTSAGIAGASTALAVSAELVNTAKLVSAAGASGSVFSALAAQIVNGGGSIDLTNASTVASLAAAAGLNASAATAIGQIASASNLAVKQAASTNAGNPTAILSAVTAVSQVAQGTTAAEITAANGNATQLSQVVASNTGSALAGEIAATAAGSSSGVVTGAPTNNVSSTASQILQGILTHLGSAAQVTYLGTAGTAPATVNLSTNVGVVTPGANLSIHATTNADLLVSGGSTVDLSGSQLLDSAGAGQHLSLAVSLGDGNNTLTLNHGPSSAQSSTGNDTIISSGGHDTLFGGSGHDSLVGGGHSQLIGGLVGDTLVGGLTAGSHDTLVAGYGSDLITTNLGHNTISGYGRDLIQAGSAQDTIYAGVGRETVTGGVSSLIGGGDKTFMTHGNQNTYNATGADTIFGSNYNNTVNINDGSNGVFVNGKTGTGALTVNVNTTQQGSDTLFGGSNPGGTGSNLTVHVTQGYTVAQNLDSNGLQVVQLAGGQTLHVNNVMIDFNGTKTLV